MPHLCAVALFVLLAAAAGAWIVAAHLLPGVHRLRSAGSIPADELQFLQLLLLLALNIAREVLHAALGRLALRLRGGGAGCRGLPCRSVGRLFLAAFFGFAFFR